jgi:hypothetical protein
MTGVPRWAWIALGGLLLIGAFYAALSAYGHERYKAGKKAADDAWIEASNKTIQKAQSAGTAADTKAAARVADFAAKVEDEKGKIDAAQKEGSSPLDVLFGNGS